MTEPCIKEAEIARIDTTTKAMAKQLTEIHMVMFKNSNGRGLVERVNNNTDDIGYIQGSIKTRASKLWDFAKIIVAAALPIVILWLSGHL